MATVRAYNKLTKLTYNTKVKLCIKHHHMRPSGVFLSRPPLPFFLPRIQVTRLCWELGIPSSADRQFKRDVMLKICSRLWVIIKFNVGFHYFTHTELLAVLLPPMTNVYVYDKGGDAFSIARLIFFIIFYLFFNPQKMLQFKEFLETIDFILIIVCFVDILLKK